ncbi:MAG: FKBP-type peptidyl-prolyl cis-trans isomerase [Halioglobus sp.]|jgi:FKBP-type peptidyl-prolyl cis-trans isomerase
MKKYALPLALSSLFVLQACNQQTPTAEAPEAAVPAVALESSAQRLSYGIAYGLGERMKADSVPMDVDAFSLGLRDALETGEPRLSQEEIAAEMQAFQQKAQEAQQVAQASAGEANAVAAAAFLAENSTKEGVVVTESGLQYQVVKAGDGAKPGAEDTVEVHYRGTLLDGTEFDSSYARGETVSFGVGQVIAGWTEALQLMSVGSTWKLFIPSDIAYGAGGAGASIGPNATLIFDVELISIAGQEEK